MKKLIEVKFDELAYNEYLLLKENNNYIQLLKSIDKTIKKLKNNPFCGDLIKKKQIPKKTIEKYGTDQIFRIKLTNDWRLIYTVIGDEVKIIAFILDFMNHKKYNNLFGYKN